MPTRAPMQVRVNTMPATMATHLDQLARITEPTSASTVTTNMASAITRNTMSPEMDMPELESETVPKIATSVASAVNTAARQSETIRTMRRPGDGCTTTGGGIWNIGAGPDLG